MGQTAFQFFFDVYDSINELDHEDGQLLLSARQATSQAYAPYSGFRVSAVARLANGKIVTGTNQENASFPAGICAERVLLSAVSALYPDVQIESIAVSYLNEQGQSNRPISPCGICRQSLQEYENRMERSIRLILGGAEGKIYIIPRSSFLLPLAFTGDELK
jgi:cytidine deaminase